MKFLNADFLTIQTIASLLTLSTATFIFRGGDPSYLYNVDLNGDRNHAIWEMKRNKLYKSNSKIFRGFVKFKYNVINIILEKYCWIYTIFFYNIITVYIISIC